MAVVDKYVDTDAEADKLTVPAFNGKGTTFTAIAIVSVDSGDSDGSKYRLFRSINSDLIPVSITFTNDALTSGSDYDLGLYEPNSGVVVDKDELADGISMTSGRAEGSGVTGLDAVSLANTQKKLFELAGQTVGPGGTKDATFDIVLTANTVGSTTGKIVVKATFVQG